jgi:E3 ubiquitin-protein ligase TRIP12
MFFSFVYVLIELNLLFEETTGSCLTKSILRRSQQQHDVATTLSVSTTATTSSHQTTTNAPASATVDPSKTSSNPSKKHTAQTTIKQNFARIMNQQQTTSSQTTSTTNTATTTNASAVPLSNAARGLPISESESDNDNSEFSRLTDILQARGLPSHIVNAFGTKVQQFLSRTISNGMPSRSQQLIQTLQQPDESLKLTALSEMCQLLVMGNEDTLIGFPIKQAVPLLIQCMNTDTENFDLMNHACRALTYMMESLPRSSSIIAEGKYK